MDVHAANGARFIARDDMIVAWERAEAGRVFEPETTAWMRDVLASRSGAFVDVGASTGWFSVPFAMGGREVHAFEPLPAAFARLAENAALNGVSFCAYPLAVSNRDGDAVLMHNRVLPLTSGGSIERAPVFGPVETPVKAARLDAVLPEEADVALLKVDVEGHELAVLEGARGVVSRCQPHLVLEANTLRDRNAITEWLSIFGGYVVEGTQVDLRNILARPERKRRRKTP